MPERKRRLSAILSADAVSYSRLMGEDERATLRTLNAYREVFRQRVGAHEGRVVDTAGDSVLAVFDSVVEAVHCAIEVQREIDDRNNDLRPERRMHFRIGVNLGDVIEQSDGTIYGDGVNIAARLQSLADPGGITLSGSAHDFVDGKISAAISFVGDHEVKNIVRPIKVYRIGPETALAPTAQPKAPSDNAFLPDRPSIAVLPFVNMSEDVEEAYFADGISEDIITELSRFQELIVTARNSTFAFKGKTVNAREIGRQLSVRYILEGSVRKAGERVRVTAQLIEAAGGTHLWAERYDRDLKDVFAVQDELTSKIVATLVGKLTDSERRRVRAEETPENPRAYELLLRGRELFFRLTKEDNLAARRMYEQALEADADYARTYGSLAWTYMIAYNEYWSDDPQGDLDQALELAQKGVGINRASHGNWLALGQVHYFRKQLGKATEAFEKARELNPNDADVYAFLSQAMCLNGEAGHAIELLDRALALNAYVGSWHYSFYLIAYFTNHQYEDALAIYERIENPQVSYYRWIAPTYAYLGRLEEAREAGAKYREHYPNFDLEEHLSRIPFARKEDKAHYGEGLRMAGFE